MTTVRRTLLAAALLLCACAQADVEVLWWRVAEEDNPQSFANLEITGVDGNPVRIGDLRYQGLEAESIRLRVVGNGVDLYLPLVDPDYDLEGQQTGDLPGNFYALVGEYSAAAYTFAVELGNETEGQWVIMASTGYQTYAQLDSLNHIHDWTDIRANVATPWLPSFVVPEPSSGLLLLLGGGLLALRRRRGGYRATRAPRAPRDA